MRHKIFHDPGTLAAHLRPGDRAVFYEIDPQVRLGIECFGVWEPEEHGESH